MKSKLQFAAILLPLCLLAGCGNQPDSQADAVSAVQPKLQKQRPARPQRF